MAEYEVREETDSEFHLVGIAVDISDESRTSDEGMIVGSDTAAPQSA